MKAHYRLKQNSECINSANELLKKDPRHEEAAYFKACAFTRLRQFDDAITMLREIMSIQKQSSNDMFSLYGALCYQITPPNYEAAIDTFTELIHHNPGDFESVSELQVKSNQILMISCSCTRGHVAIVAFKNGLYV
jgi:tetratricopeptide (TPR) repeat protein